MQRQEVRRPLFRSDQNQSRSLQSRFCVNSANPGTGQMVSPLSHYLRLIRLETPDYLARARHFSRRGKPPTNPELPRTREKSPLSVACGKRLAAGVFQDCPIDIPMRQKVPQCGHIYHYDRLRRKVSSADRVEATSCTRMIWMPCRASARATPTEPAAISLPQASTALRTNPLRE